jgi:hypothetical protein
MPGATVERELILTRGDGVWMMSDPDQRLYILREQAVDVLEKQLRLMLQSDSRSRDKRALIKALNLLYESRTWRFRRPKRLSGELMLGLLIVHDSNLPQPVS